jgi:hypothetical protein
MSPFKNIKGQAKMLMVKLKNVKGQVKNVKGQVKNVGSPAIA